MLSWVRARSRTMPRKTPDGIAEGFERQRLLVVPEFRSRQVATLPILRDLRITAGNEVAFCHSLNHSAE